ncbi:MAG: beta-lactamase family protein [Deltaproteobacteria bacterium]|nr:beta-lactamase family protein [Deltaproteobacteria bacterium]
MTASTQLPSPSITASSASGLLPRFALAATLTAVLAVPSLASAAPLPTQLDPTVLSVLNANMTDNTPGIAAAVVVNGKIYYNQVGKRRVGSASNALATDRWQMGSISKVMTGEWIARWVEAGYLDWSTELGTVMPELFTANPSNPYRHVTLAQLMSHTSGMPYSPATCTMCPDNEFQSVAYIPDRRYNYVKEAIKDAPLFSPGTVATYGGGAIIATAMVERILGTSYEQSMSSLFIAASMGNTADFNPLSAAFPNVTGVFSHIWDGYFFSAGSVPQAPVDQHVLRSPVGGVNASLIGMANFASYAMQTDPDRWQTMGRGAFTSTGWILTMNDAASGAQLWHNGSNGSNYAEATVWPERGVAVIVATNYVDALNGTQAAQVGAVTSGLINKLSTWNAPAPVSPFVGEPTYQLPLASVAASNVYGCSGAAAVYPNDAGCGQAAYKGFKAFDGKFATRWATDSGVTSAWIEAKIAPSTVTGMVLSEGGPYENGYRITGFTIYLWSSATNAWYTAHVGTTIGAQRKVTFSHPFTSITKAFISVSTSGSGLTGPTLQELQLIGP